MCYRASPVSKDDGQDKYWGDGDISELFIVLKPNLIQHLSGL